MPLLDKNPRHEEFAQKIAAGLSTSKAYEAAGFPRDRSNAARLKKKLLPRIREIENATVRMTTLIERRADELTTVRLAKAASREIAHIVLTREKGCSSA